MIQALPEPVRAGIAVVMILAAIYVTFLIALGRAPKGRIGHALVSAVLAMFVINGVMAMVGVGRVAIWPEGNYHLKRAADAMCGDKC